MASTNLDEIEKKILEGVNRVVEELGLAEAVTIVDGSLDCSQCIRIEVDNVESFIKALSAVLRQGMSIGGLPVLIVRKRTSTLMTYAIVDYSNRLVVQLSLSLTY